MAEKEFDPDDPFTLTGMVLPLSAGEARIAEEDMASCFIEEFMMLGYDDERLLALFKDPFYQGTNAVFQSRGEQYVRELIDRVRRGEPAAQTKEN